MKSIIIFLPFVVSVAKQHPISHAMLKSLCFLFCLLLPGTLLAQSAPTPRQIQRLAQAGKLWGQIKYFHPWLAYRPVAWDSAFVVAVPNLLAANTDDEYVAVLQRMLAVLGDRATMVSLHKPTDVQPAFINTERGRAFLQDSVLVVRLNSKAVAEDWNETEGVMFAALRLVEKARAVVFDLRLTEPGSRLARAVEMNLEFANAFLTNVLSPPGLSLPGDRWLTHQGFVPELKDNGIYQSYFSVSHAMAIQPPPNRKPPVPVVFLMNEHVATPKLAALLQKQGWARILTEEIGVKTTSESGVAGRAAIVLDYHLGNLDVRLRKTELVDEAGLLEPRADSVLTPQTDYAINLQKAIDMVRQPRPAPAARPVVPGRYAGLWKSDRFTPGRYPDLGHRVLASAKMHAVVHYFFPNQDLMDLAWDSAYVYHLPAFVTAVDSVAYAQSVTAFHARIQDSHGFTGQFQQLALQPFFGKQIPTSVMVSKVQDQVVISRILSDSVARRDGLSIGDVVLRINDEPALSLLNKARPYLPASNREAQERELSKWLLSGDDGTTAHLTIRKKDGSVKTVDVVRRNAYLAAYRSIPHRSPFGRSLPLCTLLAGNVGYVDLFRVTVDNVDSIMTALRHAKGIIFDDRSYPSSAAQQLFNYLPDANKEEVGLRQPIVDADAIRYGDGSMRKTMTITLTDLPKPVTRKWVYSGKVVVLFNEFTQSYAEGLAGRFKEIGGVGVGSHTAGANGDVTNFFIPGGFLHFSGAKAAVQRVGVQPDLVVVPTLKGVQASRDEVMERAVQYLQTGK